MTESGLRFRVLGAVEFFDGARWAPIGPAKQRRLLALLLMKANQTVAGERLIADLWGDAPPASATGLLAGYVWRLRQALADRGAAELVTKRPGYHLVVAPTTLDVHRYEAFAAAGRAQLARRELAAAVDSFTAALDVWRDEPYADVPSVPAIQAERTRLEDTRLSLIESKIDAQIRLGHHEAVVPELRLLVAQHPLRESLHAHLMLALYRCGQQAGALSVHRELRQLLISELGVEPGRRMRDLQQRVLRDDQSLLGTPAHRSTKLSPAAPQRLSLPRRFDVPLGQERKVSAVTASLLSGERICAVHGLAGSGKTAVAVHAADQVAEHFPDGRLYLDMRGSSKDPPLSPFEALTALLRAVDSDDGRADPPIALDDAEARWQEATASRRLLVVLDDVRGPEQVEPLLTTAPRCAVLLVGRPALLVAGGPTHVQVGRLSATASVDLVAQVAGSSRVRADHQAAGTIARYCEHLPLAVRLAADRLATRPMWSLADFAARLADPRHRLDQLCGDDRSVRDSLAAGLRLLRRNDDRAAATALQLLGVLDLPVVSTASLAALLQVSIEQAHPVAEHLVDAGFVEAITLDEYHVPQLVRLFAVERQDPTVDADAALSRVVDHYVALADAQAAHASPASLAAWYRREIGTLRALAMRDRTGALRRAVRRVRLSLPVRPPRHRTQGTSERTGS